MVHHASLECNCPAPAQTSNLNLDNLIILCEMLPQTGMSRVLRRTGAACNICMVYGWICACVSAENCDRGVQDGRRASLRHVHAWQRRPAVASSVSSHECIWMARVAHP